MASAKRRIGNALLFTVEIPLVLMVLAVALLFVGLGSDYFVSMASSVLVGSVCCAAGIKVGRRLNERVHEFHAWQMKTELIPRMLDTIPEELPEEAREGIREALQAELREAKEGIARVMR